MEDGGNNPQNIYKHVYDKLHYQPNHIFFI